MPSAAQDDLDVDAVRPLEAHQLAEGTLVRVEVDEPLVDAHLPAVVGLRALSVRALPHGDLEALRRKGDGPAHRHAGALADLLDLVADAVDLFRVRAGERDAGFLRHGTSRCL